LGLKLSEIQSRTKATQITAEGLSEPLEFVFKLNSITPAMEAKLRTNKDSEEPMREQYDAVAELLVSWNITDDNDEPIAATAENLYELGADILVAISQKIIEESLPKKTTGMD
jgi:hypothetical protein